MIDLSLYPKFQSDVQGTTVSLHPLIVIHSSPNTYYLSQNDETLIVEGVQTHFTSANLKVPSIKESLDLKSRRIKINNVTLSFSNYNDFSDKFSTEAFVNKYVDIYWKSPSCKDLSECLLVYKAVISRVDHDYKNVKFILEDKTEAVIHKDVPTTLITNEVAHRKQDVNKRLPITYGDISHAPAFLWKTDINDIDTIKYIHVLSDSYDYTNVGGDIPDSGHNLDGFGWETHKSKVSIYTGNYMYIAPFYNPRTPGADPPNTIQTDVIGNILTLMQVYEGEFPRNTISVNEAQVVINRRASSASLLDYQASGNGYNYNYIGASEDVYLENTKNAFTPIIMSYDNVAINEETSYASVPQIEYDGIVFDEDVIPPGWLGLTSFQSGNSLDGDPVKYRSVPNDYGHVEEEGSLSGAREILSTLAYYTLAYEGVELLSMPDAKKLYDMFLMWWQDNGRDISDVRIYNHESSNHVMYMSGIRVIFKIHLYSDWNTPDAGSDFAYIVNTVNVWGEEMTTFTPPTDDPTPVVELWDLINTYSGRVYGNEDLDIPRYKMIGETGEIINTYNYTTELLIDYDIGEPYSGEYDTFHGRVEYYNKNYSASWNGVSASVWNNSGDWGGGDSLSNPWITPDPEDYETWQQRQEWSNSNPQQYNKWQRIYCNTHNWWVHYTEPVEFRETTYERGRLFPTKHVNPYQTGSRDIGRLNGMYNYRWNMTFNGNKYEPGGIMPQVGGHVALSDGISNLSDDRRIGIVYSLEDSGTSDIKSDSGLTQFWGKFSYTPDSESINPDAAATLKVNFAIADIDVEDESSLLDSIGVGTLIERTYGQLAEGYPVVFNNRQMYGGDEYPYDVVSSLWTNPDQFNAAFLKFWVESDTTEAAAVKINLHKLGVKHIATVENLFEKDFFVSSNGRTPGGNSPPNIIRNLINTELEVTPELGSNYEEANSYCENYPLAFSVTKKINSKKLIENIAKSTPVIPYFQSTLNGSSLNFAIVRNEYQAEHVQMVIKSSDVIKNSFSRTKIEDVKTMIKINYKKDYGNNSYKESTMYRSAYDLFGNGDVGSPNFYSKEYLGLDPNNPGDSALEINNEYIRDVSVANKLRDFLVAYNCNQHLILSVDLPLTYVHLEISDIISFDSLIQGKLAFGDNYSTQGGVINRNGQVIYPYFMITDINKSVKSVKIKCTQLHKLTPTDGIVSTGSGDLNMSGGVPDESDFEILTNYVTYGDKYFTEGQLKNSDINSDGLVDETDLSLLSDIYVMSEIGGEALEEESVNMYNGYNHVNEAVQWQGEGSTPGTFTPTSNNVVQFNGNGNNVNGLPEHVFFPWAFPLCIPGNTYKITLTVNVYDSISPNSQISVALFGNNIYNPPYIPGGAEDWAFNNEHGVNPGLVFENELYGNGTISFEWTCESEGQAPILNALSSVVQATITCELELISEAVVEEDEIDDTVDFEGATIIEASGGDAETNGFIVSAGGSTVLGFSMTGATIPAGCGTLTNLTFDGDAADLVNITVADYNGNHLDFLYYVGSGDINTGCDLPPNTLYLLDGAVLYNSETDIGGFQFNVTEE